MPPPGMGARLHFNSLWLQPGSSGADMFLQPAACWRREINFVHPARPTLGRTLTFIEAVKARAVVVFPASSQPTEWWSSWALPGGPGVLETFTIAGFRVVVISHIGSD